MTRIREYTGRPGATASAGIRKKLREWTSGYKERYISTKGAWLYQYHTDSKDKSSLHLKMEIAKAKWRVLWELYRDVFGESLKPEPPK